MIEIPSVKVFENITPINAGDGDGTFVYDGLDKAVAFYKQSHALRSAAAWESAPGTLEDTRTARQLAMEYILRTALQAVESPNGVSSELWADRFTQASIELYGQPDAKHVVSLLTEERAQLVPLLGDKHISRHHLTFLLDTYASVLEGSLHVVEVVDDLSNREFEKRAVQIYGTAISEKYQALFELVDDWPKEELGSEDLRGLFTKALNWMTEHDDRDWSLWEAVMKEKGTAVSTSSEERRIFIPKKRPPANHSTARKLIAHELLVHALRGKNAHKSGDDLLVQGLPGFLDAEEGLGLVSEETIEGEDAKGRNRYIDIALALGVVDGKQRNRSELFQCSWAREIVQAQLQGGFTKNALPALERSVWSNIDRIYRGGKGNSTNYRQAIYTKDLAYYNGYRKMVGYISGQIKSGKSAAAIFNYLSQGSFDPTNHEHTERLFKTSQI